MRIAEGPPQERELLPSAADLEKGDVPLAHDVAERQAAPRSEHTRTLPQQRGLVPHQVRRFEHPHRVERGVAESVVRAVALFEAGPIKLSRRGQRRTGFDAAGARGDPEHGRAQLGDERAGLVSRPAAHVEDSIALSDVRPLEHEAGEGAGGSLERRVGGGEEAVVEFLAHDEFPGAVDAVVVRRRGVDVRRVVSTHDPLTCPPSQATTTA